MPLTRSAIKKQRQDKKREAQGQEFKEKFRSVLKKAKKDKKLESVKKAISLIDKAIKRNLFHKNKGARIKSSLAKLLTTKKIAKETAKKNTSKKTKLAAKTSSSSIPTS